MLRLASSAAFRKASNSSSLTRKENGCCRTPRLVVRTNYAVKVYVHPDAAFSFDGRRLVREECRMIDQVLVDLDDVLTTHEGHAKAGFRSTGSVVVQVKPKRTGDRLDSTG